MKKALDVIDSVHTDGLLASLKITNKSSKTSNGYMRPTGRFATSELNVSRSTGKITKTDSDMMTTLFHEMGHVLDHEIFADRQRNDQIFGTMQKVPILQKLMQTIKDSNTFKVLVLTEKPYWLTNNVHKEYITYLCSDDELFARTYAQYIAFKSGQPDLLDSLIKRNGHYLLQLDNQDFQPILQEFDTLFNSLGWLIKK